MAQIKIIGIRNSLSVIQHVILAVAWGGGGGGGGC